MNLLIKFLVNGIIAVPGLLWSGTSLWFSLLATVAFTLLAYGMGDVVILPRTNNTFAAVSDFVLAFAFFWAASVVFLQPFRLSGLFLTSFALSVAEYVYHGYLQRAGTHHSKHPG